MYLLGTFRLFSSLIFSSFIRSTSVFCAYQLSWNLRFSISFSFCACSPPSYLSTICFFSSLACFFSRLFRSFYSFSSISFSSRCLRTADSNSAFSAFVCSSSLRSFSSCCSMRASCSSLSFFALISAYTLSFSLAARSFDSTALLALKASNSACLSEAFSWSSLKRWISFSFSSLIRLNEKTLTFVRQRARLPSQPSRARTG